MKFFRGKQGMTVVYKELQGYIGFAWVDNVLQGYILVMQNFQVVCISHESLVYQENRTQKHCISNYTMQCTMGRLRGMLSSIQQVPCVLIGCIFLQHGINNKSRYLYCAKILCAKIPRIYKH